MSTRLPSTFVTRAVLGVATTAAALVLAGCALPPPPVAEAVPERPAEVRARIAALLPPNVADRSGWAVDYYAAFAALGIAPSTSNLCAAIAVTEQESSFNADPPVPGLGAIAWKEIDQRAERAGVPVFAAHAALRLASPDGRSYAERIDAAKTERQLSEIFEDFIGMVPLGNRLLADKNPVRTGGPMQVGIAFAQAEAQRRTYPYPVARSIRAEVFTRRGGLFFGIAHLLDYPAAYDKPLYRFADFNAGRHASRNAAFQNALSLASGIPLVLDGDVLPPAGAPTGSTELAAGVLAPRLELSKAQIRSDLERGDAADFATTRLYERTFALAERSERRTLPRAVLPRITLQSPKITRHLTTAWFAEQVDKRHQRCIARGAARSDG